MNVETYLRKAGKLVCSVDPEKAVLNNAICQSYMLGASKSFDLPLTVIWSAWGERHVREAMATASWFASINRPVLPKMRCVLWLLGDQNVVSEECKQRVVALGVDIRDGGPAPINSAMFDVARMKLLASTKGPVLYMDTDLYSLNPVDPARLGGKIQSFGIGPGHTGGPCEIAHNAIDAYLGASSVLYYKDIGLTRADYETGDFWPWIRVNLGMLYADDGKALVSFVEEFQELNETFAETNYFGIGEMIFTALHNKREVPGHSFTWRNGWNKIWPWIDRHDQCIETIWEDDIVVGARPLGYHDIIHMSHFGVTFHGGGDPRHRKFHMWIGDNAEFYIHIGNMPKRGGSTAAFGAL